MMDSLRSIKRRARLQLHQIMQVSALYFTKVAPPTNPYNPGDPEYDSWVLPPGPYYSTIIPVNVRVHSKDRALVGDLPATDLNYAERREVIPTILFMRSELAQPARNAIVSVEPGEAYRIDNVMPHDDLSISAQVTRLTPTESAGLPVPEA